MKMENVGKMNVVDGSSSEEEWKGSKNDKDNVTLEEERQFE